jgi:hypothetical protein
LAMVSLHLGLVVDSTDLIAEWGNAKAPTTDRTAKIA